MSVAPSLAVPFQAVASRPLAQLGDLWPALLKGSLWAAVLLGSTFAGFVVTFVGLPKITALVLVLTVGLAVSPLIGIRGLPLAGLLVSVPLPIAKHLTYRADYMGSADGITIELIDIWMAWLVIQYAYLLKTDQVKPIRGIGAFCLPIAVLLLADILSFRQSADAALSLYGLLADLRATVLFILVAVTLVQGADEVRGALTGMLWAVLMIGALCVFETAVGVNFREDPFVADQEAEWAGPFRARGFNSATNTAAYLAVLMPIVVVEVSRASSLSRIWLARAALVAGLTGLACTLTRSAIGFLAVGSLPLIVFLFRQRILRFKHAFIALAAGVVLLVALGDLIRSRMNEESENMTARFGLIGTALNMAADSPLTGQGTNNYMLKMQEFSPKRQIHHFEFIVHNKFLLTLAETGTLGLVAFVWFIVVTLTRAVSLARRQSLLGVGLLCSLIVVVLNMNMEIYAGGFTLFTFWVIAAFVAALSQGRAGDSTLAHEAAR